MKEVMNSKNWFIGVRVYIAIAVVLVTGQAWWWSRATYGTSNLATIRLQEVYAWLSVGLLAAALLIGPLLKVAPKLPGKMLLRDARRLIGVGAAWFALLHAGLSYGPLFGWPDPTSLSPAYQRSFALGLLGLIVLLLMAVTSFDGAMRRLGLWWFRLHRLIYIGAVAALLHAFMVGTHAAELIAIILTGICAIGLLLLHVWILFRSEQPTNLQIITVSLLAVFVVAVINYGVTQYLGYNFFLDSHQGYTP